MLSQQQKAQPLFKVLENKKLGFYIVNAKTLYPAETSRNDVKYYKSRENAHKNCEKMNGRTTGYQTK